MWWVTGTVAEMKKVSHGTTAVKLRKWLEIFHKNLNNKYTNSVFYEH